MALGDGKAKKETEEIRDELAFILDAVTSIGDKLVASFEESLENAGSLNNQANVISNTLKRGLVADIKQSVKNTEELVRAEVKAEKGLLKQSEVQKLQNKLAETRLLFETRQRAMALQGLELSADETSEFEKQIQLQESTLNKIKANNDASQDTLGLFDLIQTSAIGFANNIDKSGTLAKVLNGELTSAQRATLAAQAGFAVFVASMLKGSSLITNIRKETGLSYEAARDFQLKLAQVALNSEKIFITSERLNKSFLELTKQTGLIADFGGDILITQSTLTKQLDLSAEQASKLSILSRIQSENTEGILDNTVSAVSALSRQEGVGLNVKGILEEVANVSDSIAVSLGKNPIEIAKAVTQAKLLGLSLSEVDAIASSLLDFESSITAELEAELLIGKNLNLEKARLLALNNDLAGLGEELRNQEEIRLAFANGNRIQQEAAAKAIGINRDQLAKMVLQQDLNNMAAEQFVATYGEATYQSLQSQSASEKFADTLEKIKGILGDIGTAFAPILDGIASFVSFLAQSKAGVIALSAVFTGLLALSVGKAIADAVVAFTLAFGPAGVPLGIAAGGAILGAVGAGLAIADDMIAPPGYGERILSTPEGSIALNNQDTIVAGTNLGGGSNTESKRTNQLLEMILNKQGTVKMNTSNVGTAFSMNTYEVQ